jgi:hypothetical protein
MMKAGYMWFGGTYPPDPPMEYRDLSTGMTVTSDIDGRTVTAKDRDGNQVWIRDPFVDANMCPYRTAHPYISRLGPPNGDFGQYEGQKFVPTSNLEANENILKQLRTGTIRVYKIGELRNTDHFAYLWFNSSQFGVVNLRNGDFYLFGQN